MNCTHEFEYVPLGTTYKRNEEGKISLPLPRAPRYLKACTKCPECTTISGSYAYKIVRIR